MMLLMDGAGEAPGQHADFDQPGCLETVTPIVPWSSGLLGKPGVPDTSHAIRSNFGGALVLADAISRASTHQARASRLGRDL